jgi:chitosanase
MKPSLRSTLVVSLLLAAGCAAQIDDGIDDSGTVFEASSFTIGSALAPGMTLTKGGCLHSPNGNYRAAYQTDGNFVVYAGRTALWASNTQGRPSNALVLERGGNLVLFNGQTKVWETRTASQPPRQLVMQDDGNLVLYKTNGGADWATDTWGGPSNTGGPAPGQSTDARAVALAMTSIWENDTPRIDYAYAENIDDGRGYTSGRAGFCTGTGDAILVVECYAQRRSAANGNLLAKYLPALRAINDAFEKTGQDQGDTSKLDAVGHYVADWAASWNNATTRADFKSCQDEVADNSYYEPALAAARTIGLTSPLSHAAFYDLWLNHGDEGAAALVKATHAALGLRGGKLAKGVTESAWLAKLLELRRDVLAADATWVEAVDRIAGYEKARRRGNWKLDQPVDNAVKAADCWPSLKSKLPDSGYTPRVINPDGSWATRVLTGHGCQ